MGWRWRIGGWGGLQEECLQEKRESDILSEPLTGQKLGLGVGDYRIILFKNVGRINDSYKENKAIKRRQTWYYRNLRMHIFSPF